MNPNDLIFQAISSLTGGLITDLTTAIIGIVCLSFIAMGFDLVLDVLLHRHKRNAAYGNVERSYRLMQEAEESGSRMTRDLARDQYRRAVRRYGRAVDEDGDW